MTVKEFAEKKVQELESQGCKKVRVVNVGECKIRKHSYSHILFNPAAVPMDAEVVDKKDLIFKDDFSHEYTGAMVTVAYVKPRCRKESREYFRAALQK